ncbi:hypothetical protein, partial [Pseudolactococcus yaeyamensis]
RKCYLIKDIDWLDNREKWVGLRCVFAIKRTVETKYKITEEMSYYISSLETNLEKIIRYCTRTLENREFALGTGC